MRHHLRKVAVAAIISAFCLMAAAPAVHATPGFAGQVSVSSPASFFTFFLSFLGINGDLQGARIDANQGARIDANQGARIDANQGARIDANQGARIDAN